MADGSRTVALEAEAAAAEAAREAKAEVLERAVKVENAAPLPRASQRKARRPDGRTAWTQFTVDVWITNFNSVEFGIYKHSRNRAKSRQFTTDMDIFAEVIENG